MTQCQHSCLTQPPSHRHSNVAIRCKCDLSILMSVCKLMPGRRPTPFSTKCMSTSPYWQLALPSPASRPLRLTAECRELNQIKRRCTTSSKTLGLSRLITTFASTSKAATGRPLCIETSACRFSSIHCGGSTRASKILDFETSRPRSSETIQDSSARKWRITSGQI